MRRAGQEPALAKAGGKKDRYVILSPNPLNILREWWGAARQKGWMHSGQPWLFPGYRRQHMLHRLVCMAAERASLAKGVGGYPCGTALPPIFWNRRPISASTTRSASTRASVMARRGKFTMRACGYVDDRRCRPAALPSLPERARKAEKCSPSPTYPEAPQPTRS
jgi:integrase